MSPTFTFRYFIVLGLTVASTFAIQQTIPNQITLSLIDPISSEIMPAFRASYLEEGEPLLTAPIKELE